MNRIVGERLGDLVWNLLESASQQVLVFETATGRILECNNAAIAGTGFGREELLARHIFDIDTLMTAALYNQLIASLSTSEELGFRSIMRRKDGITIPVEVNAWTDTLPDGRRITIAVIRDISQLKLLTDELQSAKRQYDGLARNLPGVVYRVDADWRVLWIDSSVEGLTGWPAEAFFAGEIRIATLLAPEDMPRMRAAFLHAIATGGGYDVVYTMIGRNGDRRTVHDIGHAATGTPGGAPTIEGVAFDITERTERERVLREALTDEHRRYEQVVAASGQVVYEADLQSGAMTFSGSVYEVFGYTPEEHGADRLAWQSRVHADDLARVTSIGRAAIAAGESAECEYRYLHADGAYRWVWDRCTHDLDGDGKPIRTIGVMQDVTARKQLEAQVSSAQRMETIGALAGGVAHDVNNFLAAILGNIDIARMRIDESEIWPELEDARQAALGCADLVRSLLTFARQQDPMRSRLDARSVLEESGRILQRVAGPGALVSIDAPEGLCFYADRVQIQQVVLNLVTNARDAMRGEGCISIAAERVRGVNPQDDRPGIYVRVSVADTGPGISHHLAARIFEPYFSTRPLGEGTGLGLSIVHGIARSHGGWVEVESPPGEGATFNVYFPAE